MKFTHQKVLAITNLPGPDRYSHFVKVAADLRSVWGLYQDGWALMRDSDGNSYFPMWPAEPYAAQCAVSEWAGYQPREIDLDDLFDALIPKLRDSDTGVAVFPTPTKKGVTPDLEVLETDLRAELGKFNASLAALMPEEEDGPSLFAPQAEDAVAATMYALRCLVHGDAQEAAWAARRAYESADNLVITRPTVEIGGFEEDKILRDPLIQEELSQQARDLLDASVTKIDRDALIKLRNNCLQWGRDHLQRATS